MDLYGTGYSDVKPEVIESLIKNEWYCPVTRDVADLTGTIETLIKIIFHYIGTGTVLMCWYYIFCSIAEYSSETLVWFQTQNCSLVCSQVESARNTVEIWLSCEGSRYTLYATLAYTRHFIFAGCYDNDTCDPWYLGTNFAGHLEILRGIYILRGFIKIPIYCSLFKRLWF